MWRTLTHFTYNVNEMVMGDQKYAWHAEEAWVFQRWTPIYLE
jgi:hypothetical protein